MSIRAISDGVMGDYIRNHNYRCKLNRLYFNTLNLSKLYLDRHYHEKNNKSFVKSITGLESSHDEVRQHRQRILNSNTHYALGCALRNYVQHASLPVKTFTSGVRFEPQDNQYFAVFHIPLDRKALIDGGVKKNKLSKYSDKIDLHEIMDGYIGRGRNSGHPLPPAQIRTCATNAYGSYLGSNVKSLLRIRVDNSCFGDPVIN